MSIAIKWIKVLPGCRASKYTVGEVLEVVVLDNKGQVKVLKDRKTWEVDNKWFKFVDPPEVSCI